MPHNVTLSPAEQLNLIMKAISFAFALLVVLVGFGLGGWTYVGAAHSVDDASRVAGGIMALTVTLAGLTAAIGGLMPWDVFLRLLPGHSGGGEGINVC